MSNTWIFFSMQSSIHLHHYHNCPLVAYIMPFTCPKNKAEWAAAVKTYNVIGKTLLTWPDLRSGFKVNKEQYLLYRVLLPDCKEPEFLNPLRLGIPTILITQAQNVLIKDKHINYI